jgi:hypothetical protein
MEHQGSCRTIKDLANHMRKNSPARLLRVLASAIDMSFSFDAVCKMPLALKHSNYGQDAVVVALPRQPGLDFAGRGFAGFPDYPHNLQLFFGKNL